MRTRFGGSSRNDENCDDGYGVQFSPPGDRTDDHSHIVVDNGERVLGQVKAQDAKSWARMRITDVSAGCT